MGRRGKEHEINVRVDDLLVGVEAHEAAFRRDIDAGAKIVVLTQVLEAVFQGEGKQIAHGDQSHRPRRAQGVAACAGAAIAAAHQGQADRVAPSGMRRTVDRRSGIHDMVLVPG